MTLEIKKIEEEKFVARFALEELLINNESDNWNTEGINKFLIKLASNVPNNEEINLIYDKEEKNKIYVHIVELFKEFVEEYNRLNLK